MPRSSQSPKETSFNLRIDPALKSAFTQATEAEDKPAAQVIRDFMRAYVRARARRAFAAQAERDALVIKKAAADLKGDESQVMREIEAEMAEPGFWED